MKTDLIIEATMTVQLHQYKQYHAISYGQNNY